MIGNRAPVTGVPTRCPVPLDMVLAITTVRTKVRTRPKAIDSISASARCRQKASPIVSDSEVSITAAAPIRG
ncbi:MAG: hypothetical protein MUE83_10790 [Tabrizicola sp.]|nr:hypothetical protein [Tabrizicola sp.]